MKFDTVTLRCDDGAEAAVFTKYIYNPAVKNNINYEITIEDSYTGGDYKGFFGRLKRAWKAFTDKPVVYTGIYCEDENKMRQFLFDCLELIDENDVKDIKTMYDMLGENTTINVYKEKSE